MNILDFARQFVGKQETEGPNRGPLVDKWKAAVNVGLEKTSVPWCACFGFAMLREFNGLDKKGLQKALGFGVKETWFPESTQSWFNQARDSARLTVSPRRGDIFLLLKQDAKGLYLPGQPHHFGFVDVDALPSVHALFATLEGNTVSGSVGGKASREGDGVYARTRHNTPGAFAFIALPDALKNRAAVGVNG